MSDALLGELAGLLRASLVAWSMDDAAHLTEARDGIAIQSDKHPFLRIFRAPPDMPFRWVVDVNGRKRTAASIVGVLRIVRQNLAPGYQPYQLTITPLPGRPS